MLSEAVRPLDDDIWCRDSHFLAWGCKGSVRMTILRSAKDLLLYSPVQLTPADTDAIRALGRVAAIVAPNLFHHLFLRPCMAEFPEARVLIPKGLEAKIGPVPGAQVASGGQATGLAGIETFVFEDHLLRETLLFHRPSRTLVTADMLYNFQAENFAAEKAFFQMIGCYGGPKLAFYHRFAIRHKTGVRRMLAAVEAWRPARIIMSHGRIVEGEDVTEAFLAAWKRLAA